MMIAVKAVAGTDLVEGPVDDPRGILGRFPLVGAFLVHQGEHVGTITGLRKKAGQSWLEAQLRKSAEYHQQIKEMIAAGKLAFALPGPGEGRIGAMAIKSAMVLLRPIDGQGLKAAIPGLSSTVYREVNSATVPALTRIRGEGTAADAAKRLNLLWEPVVIWFEAMDRLTAQDMGAGPYRSIRNRVGVKAFVDTLQLRGTGRAEIWLRRTAGEDEINTLAAHEVRHAAQMRCFGESAEGLEAERDAQQWARRYVLSLQPNMGD